MINEILLAPWTNPSRVEPPFGQPAEEILLKAGALQNAIFNSANFSSIATDAKGVIQIFNVGAERMLGYTAGDVMNTITPADISDPQELIARAEALSLELGTPITPGFEALVFKASRGIEDIYELTYIRKDGSRFPAVVSVTALRDAQDAIIGYLLIGTDNTARKVVEEEQKQAEQRLRDQHRDHDVQHDRRKQRVPGHDDGRQPEQQRDDRREREHHDHVVQRHLRQREQRMATGEPAPDEHHRRARCGGQQDKAGHVAVVLSRG
jgi:PAS domain-containing protein